MKISNNGLEFLKKEEGTVHYEYYCPARKHTIGVGCLTSMMTAEEKARTEKVELKNLKTIGLIKPVVNYGFVMVADDELINDMLMRRLEGFTNAVNKSIRVNNQFDALVSFIFNVGITAFKRSTDEKCVIYQSCDTGVVCIREFNEFFDYVIVENKRISRFRKED